jgi:glyoxylase-like metal-dependent hydrolase (beta-lactamase superfamily II)
VTRRPRFRTVTDGVYLLERANVNCYLLVDDDGIVLVDAGLPRTWPCLIEALESFGATPDDIDAVVLTHGHFDHVGMCDRLSHEHHVITHVHERDRTLARHPYQYSHQNPRAPYPFRYPRAIPVLARMVAAGAVGIKGIDARPDVEHGVPVPVPGGLVPVWSPGHTAGHCGFSLPSRGVLFAGDAIVTLDPYTGLTGPRIVAGAATADSEEALDGLDAYAQTDATILLPGHGEPFRGPVRDAVALARTAGAR